MGRTLADKVFDAHRIDRPAPGMNVLRVDRVLCHEITTPMAVTDLEARGLDRVFDRDKIMAVIDHVTPAKDTKTALQGKVLRDWARRHELPHWFDVGRNGVCHALFPEQGFIRPGQVVIMGDSHTCTHGAFGAFAAGVGTTDLEVGILKGICALRDPRAIKVEVTGRLPRRVSAKDVILRLLKDLTVRGAVGCVLEFHGPAIDRMSMDARMTVCNMAIEAGATSGICMPDRVTVDYLWPYIRKTYRTRAAALADYRAWASDPDAAYERSVRLDVSALAPQVTVGTKPDEVRDVDEVAGTAVDQVYIGSCTNGRLEDLRAAAELLRGRTIHPNVRGILSPATPDVFARADAEGLIRVFLDAGFCVTNPTCGACLGMSNGVLAPGEVCASTTNRNFSGRMGRGGMVHLMSPATAAATALEGAIADPRRVRARSSGRRGRKRAGAPAGQEESP